MLAGFGIALFVWFRSKNPDHSTTKVIVNAVILGLFILVGYSIFTGLIKKFSRSSDRVGQTIERGRELGTLGEAREALRRQAGQQPRNLRLGGRVMVSSFLTYLFGRRP